MNTSAPHVESVQVGSAEPWAQKKHETGIRKQPVDFIDVTDPGARESGGRSGVANDFVGDLKHHGGSEQAVYLVAAEELAFWSAELRKDLVPGNFGENVTTVGIDLDASQIGTRWQVGSAVLEVCGPRIPCRTFAWAIDEPRWVKRFTQHAKTGAYCKVVTPGRIAPGDEIVTVHEPNHGITVQEVFAAYSGDKVALKRALASGALPPRDHAELLQLDR